MNSFSVSEKPCQGMQVNGPGKDLQSYRVCTQKKAYGRTPVRDKQPVKGNPKSLTCYARKISVLVKDLGDNGCQV